jgi:hypothetical protein
MHGSRFVPIHAIDSISRKEIQSAERPNHCRLLIYGFLSSNSYRYKDEDIVRTNILASFKDDALAWVTVELTESFYDYPHERVRWGGGWERPSVASSSPPQPHRRRLRGRRRNISRQRWISRECGVMKFTGEYFTVKRLQRWIDAPGASATCGCTTEVVTFYGTPDEQVLVAFCFVFVLFCFGFGFVPSLFLDCFLSFFFVVLFWIAGTPCHYVLRQLGTAQ